MSRDSNAKIARPDHWRYGYGEDCRIRGGAIKTLRLI